MPRMVAVAWSGGADSTALLLGLRHAGFAVQAWHIDHGWHEDSANTAAALQQQAEQWGIPFYCKTIVKPRRNLEAESRAGRYAAFQALAQQQQCFAVALGHHADDQAETVCMRLLQGAGVAGCRGMLRQRMHGELQLWRPLLHLARSHIEACLQQHHIPWQEDPSNADTQIWRNHIRRRLFPVMQAQGVDVRDLFLRWRAQAVRVQAVIEGKAAAVQLRKYEEDGVVCCVIDWQDWLQQLAPVRAYLLQRMMGLLFEDGRVFGRRHILAIEAWREHGGHSWLNLSRCCLYRQGKGLHLGRGKESFRRYLEQKKVKNRGSNG